MMIRKLALILIPLSFYLSQNHQKTVLNNDIQEYLFSTQRILHDFIKLEDEVFNQKVNSRTSKSLESTVKMLLKNKNDFTSLFKYIYKMGYSRVLVESGLTFLNSLLKNKIIHNLYIFKSNKKLGKEGKNNSSLNYIKKLKRKFININLNDDKLYRVDFKNV